MDKLVSVIVPVYNVERYLNECVDSIINQTYSNIEIILVDDGSTDQSGVICDKYIAVDSRVKVIHQENGGLSDARNKGMDNALGDYIYFCDSDDFLDIDTIRRLTITAEQMKVDCLFFNAEAFSDDGLPFRKNSYKRKYPYETQSGVQAGIKQLIFDEYMPCVPLHFYNKCFLEQSQLRFKKGIIGEDELFSFYVYLLAEKVGYINAAFYHRRMRPGSIMTTKKNNLKKFQSYASILTDMVDAMSKVDSHKKKYCKEYLDRIAKSTLLLYKNLESDEKEKVKAVYVNVKKLIYQHKGFGDCSLLVRINFWNMGLLLSGIRKYIRMKVYEKRKGDICH